MGQRICSVLDCLRPHYGKGYCNRHWQRWRETGDPLAPARPKGPAPRPRVAVSEKACARCLEVKSARDFYRNKRNVDGLYSYCKQCTADDHGAYYERNRQAILDRVQAWMDENQERVRANSRAAYERNGDLYRQRTRQWRRDNPDKDSARHARRRAQSVPVGTVDLAALWTGACGICKLPLDIELAYPDPMSKSIDHIMPLARGGSHEQVNLQWAHLVCNQRKSARTP